MVREGPLEDPPTSREIKSKGKVNAGTCVPTVEGMEKPSLPTENGTLNRQELAERWRCCVETIKRRQASGALKALKLGRMVRYRMEDVRGHRSPGRGALIVRLPSSL